MYLSLILVLVFLFVSLLVYGVYLTATTGKRELSSRMKTYTAKTGELAQDTGLRERVSNFDWKMTFKEASKVFAAKQFTKKVEIELIKADIPLRGRNLSSSLCWLWPVWDFYLASFPRTLFLAGWEQ